MKFKRFSMFLFILVLIGASLPRISQARQSILEEGQLTLAPVDYLPPAMTAIDVEGDYAYVGAGPSLLVIDVSDPANPRRVGYELLPGMVLRVMPVQGRVYVTTRDASGDRLLIYDSSLPENLRLIADHDLDVLGGATLAVEGNRIYLAAAGDVKVLDATDPQRLVELNVYTNPEFTSVYDLHVQGGILTAIARIADPNPLSIIWYLLILDVTNPNRPEEVGRCKLSAGRSLSDVDVTDDIAVIAGFTDGGTYDYSVAELVDLSDPAHPASIARLDMGVGDYPEAALIGQRLIAGKRGEGAGIYDISDPTTPELLDYLDEPCGDMIARSERLYNAAGAVGLIIYTSPDNYTIKKQGSLMGIGSAEDISLETGKLAIADGGHHGYMTDWLYGGLAVAKAAPGQPLEITGKFIDNIYLLGRGAYLTLREDIVYLLAGNCFLRYTSCHQGLYLIDISQPQSPQNLGAYTFYHERSDTFSGPITLHAGYASLPGAIIDPYRNGVAIFDVSPPVTPTLASYFQWPSAEQYDPIYTLAITGTYGLISTFHDSQLSSSYDLRVLDFTNPISPTIIWSYPMEDQVQVLPREGLSFIAEGEYGSHGLYAFETDQLPVIDIVSDLHFSEQVLDVAYDGRYAYVADGETGLVIYDLIDPGAPRNAYTYDSPGTAKRVILDGEYVYLADGEGGVFVFRKTFLYPQAYIPLILSQIETTADLAR